MDEALCRQRARENYVACLALRVIRPGSVWEAARRGKVTATRWEEDARLPLLYTT